MISPRKSHKHRFILVFWLLLLMLAGPLWMLLFGPINLHANWRTASQKSAGIVDTNKYPKQSRVLVFAGRAFSWRGAFAVHTWIAIRKAGNQQFTVYQVVGWRAWMGRSAIVIEQAAPDREWYGNKPFVLADIHGPLADQAIEHLTRAVAKYPYPRKYWLWPGPNSNSFTAYLLRQTPELTAALPATALGKDYLINNHFWAPTPSNSGYQLSFFGIFGLTLARKEGFEINIMGLVIGLNWQQKALTIPGIGAISWG